MSDRSKDTTGAGRYAWRDFHDRFMQLACEEQGQGRADVITQGDTLRRMDRVLRVHCDYKDYPERVFVAEEVRSFYEPLGVELTSEDLSKIEAKMLESAELEKKAGLKAPETGRWIFGTGGVSENFRERVRLCVAEAGRALPDYPKGTGPEDFWLHRLWLDLLENNSDSLFCASKEGGMILSVCVASATFCARLERKAIEHAESDTATQTANPSRRASSLTGKNIDKFRKECGWTFEKLAEEVKLEKTSVLSHVNAGARPRPQNMKVYADVFTRRLGKQITVQDLEQ